MMVLKIFLLSLLLFSCPSRESKSEVQEKTTGDSIVQTIGANTIDDTYVDHSTETQNVAEVNNEQSIPMRIPRAKEFFYDFENGSQYDIPLEVYKAGIAGFSRATRDINGVEYVELHIAGKATIIASMNYSSDFTSNFLFFLDDYFMGDRFELSGGNYGVLDTNVSFLFYDFLTEMQGRQVGTSTTFVDDYNKDGFEDIIIFSMGGIGYFVYFYGYDFEEEAMVSYIDYPVGFTPIRQDYGPPIEFYPTRKDQGPPVQFITYEGMEGFKIYIGVGVGEWHFYFLDKEAKRYKKYEDYKVVDPVQLRNIPSVGLDTEEQY
jgi:hypothetical protein